jgi:hypothetical protein
MVVLFLVGLSRNILLGSLLWWHRELFFSWNHGGRQCWGSESRQESPNTRITKQDRKLEHTSHERWGYKESPKACPRLKSCESLYMCPSAPFYRETKGLLHSEITLESKEYSNVNTYKNAFYIPWFTGLISYIYKPATSSHFKRTFEATSLTWPLPDIRSSYSWKPPPIMVPKSRPHQIPELRRFLISWTSPVSKHPEINNRLTTGAKFGYCFHVLFEGQRDAWNSSGFLHECFLLTKQNLPFWKWLTNLFTNSATPTFRGCKVFAQFPNSVLATPHQVGGSKTIAVEPLRPKAFDAPCTNWFTLESPHKVGTTVVM